MRPLLILALSLAVADSALANEVEFRSGPIAFPTATFSFSNASIAFPSSFVTTVTAASIEVTLPTDILFDFDKSDVRPQAEGALREIAAMVHAEAHGPVTIKGYTDALGKDAYNQSLSERRANAIKTWLMKREGLGAIAFKTVGYGARDPVAPNRNADGSDNSAGRQLNRRVTLVISR